MWKKAVEYIRSNPKTPVMIGQLCEVIGTTGRTLHLGFKERFGLSPNAIMKVMRLNGAFQDLRTSKSKNKVSLLHQGESLLLHRPTIIIGCNNCCHALRGFGVRHLSWLLVAGCTE
jgi:AraC-like DNA-binding protein